MEKPSSEDVLKFASDAGRVLLENGAEISRVESWKMDSYRNVCICY